MSGSEQKTPQNAAFFVAQAAILASFADR